jgi:hypothetical protein
MATNLSRSNVTILLYLPWCSSFVSIVIPGSDVIGFSSIWRSHVNFGWGFPEYEHSIVDFSIVKLTCCLSSHLRKRGVNKTSRFLVACCSVFPI